MAEHEHNEEPTVESFINDNVRVNPAARAAILTFKRSKPWQGTVEERRDKFQALNVALADAYGLPAPELKLIAIDSGNDGAAVYHAVTNTIYLAHKLSVVSFLNCFAAARGKTVAECFTWSLSVFKRFFPVSYATCEHDGPFLRKS